MDVYILLTDSRIKVVKACAKWVAKVRNGLGEGRGKVSQGIHHGLTVPPTGPSLSFLALQPVYRGPASVKSVCSVNWLNMHSAMFWLAKTHCPSTSSGQQSSMFWLAETHCPSFSFPFTVCAREGMKESTETVLNVFLAIVKKPFQNHLRKTSQRTGRSLEVTFT